MKKDNMNLPFNIFSIKAISFDQGERDPFGFDDYAEKLGAEYLPFSGSVSKPAYFLFVSYVNHFLNLDKNKTLWKNEKQKREIQIRLEKLLVYSWKQESTKKELKGSSILGNSFNLDDIDVFSSKGWVIQNAFKIYTDKNFCPKTLNRYLKYVEERQNAILIRFLNVEYKSQNFDKRKFLIKLLADLQANNNSIFKNHKLSLPLQNEFKKELSEKIKSKRKTEYLQFVQPFFEYKTFNEDNFWGKLLANPKLPFLFLNDWFGKFVTAVDADINQKGNKLQLWIEADKSFDKIPKQFHSLSKTDIVLQKRVKKSKWFQYNEKESRYTYYDKRSKSEKRRVENLWESYKKRQGEEVGTRYFFNYRHYALLRLLKELQ